MDEYKGHDLQNDVADGSLKDEDDARRPLSAFGVHANQRDQLDHEANESDNAYPEESFIQLRCFFNLHDAFYFLELVGCTDEECKASKCISDYC